MYRDSIPVPKWEGGKQQEEPGTSVRLLVSFSKVFDWPLLEGKLWDRGLKERDTYSCAWGMGVDIAQAFPACFSKAASTISCVNLSKVTTQASGSAEPTA